MQGLDPSLQASMLGERGLDIDTLMIELDRVGRCNRFVEIDRVGPWLEAVQPSTQALVQVHHRRIDIVEAGGEPQPWPIKLRSAIRCADRDDPRLVRLRLEQQVTCSHRRYNHPLDVPGDPRL